jgi:hypothetical protein
MHGLPMKLATAAWLIMFSTGAFAQAAQSTTAAQRGQAAASPSQVQVDLLRGLADIFSRGMDTAENKKAQNQRPRSACRRAFRDPAVSATGVSPSQNSRYSTNPAATICG